MQKRYCSSVIALLLLVVGLTSAHGSAYGQTIESLHFSPAKDAPAIKAGKATLAQIVSVDRNSAYTCASMQKLEATVRNQSPDTAQTYGDAECYVTVGNYLLDTFSDTERHYSDFYRVFRQYERWTMDGNMDEYKRLHAEFISKAKTASPATRQSILHEIEDGMF